MHGYSYLIDSSAWIEYLNETPAGKKTAEIIEKPGNTILTPFIVSAEVISKISRSGENEEYAVNAIKSLSIPADEEIEDYFKAGKMHAELRKSFKGISLVDALIKVLAEKHNAKIVTKDFHLKGKNTVFLG